MRVRGEHPAEILARSFRASRSCCGPLSQASKIQVYRPGDCVPKGLHSGRGAGLL